MNYKYLVVTACVFCFLVQAAAQKKRLPPEFTFPDTARAQSCLFIYKIKPGTNRKHYFAHLSVPEQVSISLSRFAKNGHGFEIFGWIDVTRLAHGNELLFNPSKGTKWDYDWSTDSTQKILITFAGDSASNRVHYAAYYYLPRQNKWKLFAFYKDNAKTTASNAWKGISAINTHVYVHKKSDAQIVRKEAWYLNNKRKWISLQDTGLKPPVLMPFSNVDSVYQDSADRAKILAAVSKTGADKQKEGIFYTVLKTGNGAPVQLTDTISVFYKGYLLENDAVFDQTKEKPARFPLNRLIKGWQIALPECRVGGKMRVVIPSGQAYGIRNVAVDLPPNSVLVFDIEVTEAVPAVR
jgi:FKBP-type peptidyl-prolyl cis-trans isomerase FkpA